MENWLGPVERDGGPCAKASHEVDLAHGGGQTRVPERLLDRGHVGCQQRAQIDVNLAPYGRPTEVG